MATYVVLKNANLPDTQTYTVVLQEGQTISPEYGRNGWTVVSSSSDPDSAAASPYGDVVTLYRPFTKYSTTPRVLLPDGTIGHATVAFTSGATFDATKWTVDNAAGAGGGDLTAFAPDLSDVTVNGSAQLAASKTSNLTAAGSYTAPAPAAQVGTPPQRFAVRNKTSVAIRLPVPDENGTSVTRTVVPGGTNVYRQTTTLGYVHDGVPLNQLMRVPDQRSGMQSDRFSVLQDRDFRIDPDVLSAEPVNVTITPGYYASTLTNAQQVFDAATLAGKDSTITLLGADTLVPISNGSAFYYANWRAAWSAGSAVNAPPYGFEVLTDAANLDFSISPVGLQVACYQVFIDGQPVTEMPVLTAAIAPGTTHGLRANLPNAVHGKMRRIKVMFGVGVAVRKIWVDSWATAIAPLPRGPRMMVITDSFGTIGYGDASGNGQLDNWTFRLARELRCDDFWSDAMGSTGFVTDGVAPRKNYPTRVGTDVVPANPGLIIIWGGINDDAAGVSAADLGTGVGATLDAIFAGISPRPMVVVFASQNQTSPYGELARDAQMLAACTARGVPFVATSSGKVYDGAGNLVANLGPWTTSNNAQRAVTIGAATPGTVTYAEPHGLSLGEQVVFNSLPAGSGLAVNTNYYAQAIVSSTVVNIASDKQLGGTALAITGAGGAATVAGMVGQGANGIHPAAWRMPYMAKKAMQSLRRLMPV